MLCNPLSTEDFFSRSDRTNYVSVPISPCPVIGHHCRELGPIHLTRAGTSFSRLGCPKPHAAQPRTLPGRRHPQLFWWFYELNLTH